MKEKDELIIRVAELYYQQNLNQNAISEILKISRPMVSRLLNEARTSGVVEIKIHSRTKKNPELSLKVRNAFKLRDAIIFSGEYKDSEAVDKCGIVTDEFLHSVLENNMTIGISWGSVINSFCESLQEKNYYNVHILQLVGCLGTGNPHLDGVELAYRISHKLNGTYSNIVAPAFVDNKFVQEYLLVESQIASTIKKAANADIVLTGIGSIFNDQSTLKISGFLTDAEQKAMIKKGCVGHILARFFNKNGSEMFLTDKHPISAPLEILKSAKWSVGLCVGAYRASPVISAIKHGYINTLIADESLAIAMLNTKESPGD